LNTFIINIIKFCSILIIIFISSIYLPTTPKSSKSLLFGYPAKDSLLLNIASPRIVLIGGSNLSFGINSQLLLDSLGLFPINTGIHAALGLKFMINATLPKIQAGDIIVLVPEYNHYFNGVNRASEELLRIILDVDKRNFKFTSLKQKLNLLQFLPKYSASKFNPNDYFNYWESEVYSSRSFNNYGDTFTHWGLEPIEFKPLLPIVNTVNPKVVSMILNFDNEILNKGAKLLISYPSIQQDSYLVIEDKVKLINELLISEGLNVISNPEDYVFENSLIFDTPYHLNKTGVDLRTELLIRDIKRVIYNYVDD